MSKKNRLQMQRKSNAKQSQSPDSHTHKPGQVRQNPVPADQPQPSNMEELERQHVAWLSRRGHAYISLAETARLWNRTPEQIIRWEQVADENGY